MTLMRCHHHTLNNGGFIMAIYMRGTGAKARREAAEKVRAEVMTKVNEVNTLSEDNILRMADEYFNRTLEMFRKFSAHVTSNEVSIIYQEGFAGKLSISVAPWEELVDREDIDMKLGYTNEDFIIDVFKKVKEYFDELDGFRADIQQVEVLETFFEKKMAWTVTVTMAMN
jgi:hypothetical protein